MACTWIAFTWSKAFFSRLIVAYELNPLYTCNVKWEVNFFCHRIAPVYPALESMNRVLRLAHYSLTLPLFPAVFSFICSLVSQMPPSFPFAVLSSILCISVFAVSCCGPRQSHSLCFDYPDNTLWRYKLWNPSWRNCVFVLPRPL